MAPLLASHAIIQEPGWCLPGWDAGGAGPLLPDAKKPAMAFSMGAPSKGPARPAAQDVAAPRAMGAFAMSTGLRKAPVKKPVAGFGMDSDEEE